MKAHTQNALLTALILLGTAALAGAQQSENTVAPPPPLPPVSVTLSGNQPYYTSDNIREGDLKSKEVSKEIDIPKNGDIYIENSNSGIIIKTWDQQKVKVTTTVFYDGDNKLTDEEWFEKINLTLKTLGTSVKIRSASPSYSYSFNSDAMSVTSSGSSLTFINGYGQKSGSKSKMKKMMTITVPAGSKLDIESKYADVQLPDYSGNVNVDISNGSFEAGNLSKLILRSKYSNIDLGDVKTAEVEFANGRFSAKNIDDLDIDSKYSTIEMAAAKKIVLHSTNDEYELEDAGEVRGRKNYGNLRITKLNTSLEIDGSNADVRIRNIGASLGSIKLDDRYADIRIPLRDTKSYFIDFTGNYSSVYGNFEKKPVTDDKEDKATKPTYTSDNGFPRLPPVKANTYWNDSNGPSRFTATAGDGKGLKMEIKCQNCTVDFK